MLLEGQLCFLGALKKKSALLLDFSFFETCISGIFSSLKSLLVSLWTLSILTYVKHSTQSLTQNFCPNCGMLAYLETSGVFSEPIYPMQQAAMCCYCQQQVRVACCYFWCAAGKHPWPPIVYLFYQ